MKAFITVSGKDTIGVIARVSNQCAALGINVEDVTQRLLKGMFAMIMLVDLDHCTVSIDEMHQKFADLGQEMGMQIVVTRQEVFDAMHNI